MEKIGEFFFGQLIRAIDVYNDKDLVVGLRNGSIIEVGLESGVSHTLI